MKKIFIPLLFVSALVACSKLEVTPVVQDNKTVITYQMAPITKSPDTWKPFDTKYVFQSAAYYLTSEDVANGGWTSNASSGKEYIKPNTVQYIDNVWRMKEHYYWPKDNGALTFYSWSLNKENLDFVNSDPKVTINNEKGVVLTNYDISVQKNIDFIVAEPEYDRCENIKTYSTEGVPTLFKHQLSYLYITAKTDQDYTSSVTFTIKSIKVENVAKIGEFQETEIDSGKWKTINKWTTAGTYDANYRTTDFPVNSTTGSVIENSTQTNYIPQKFTDNEYIVVEYEIYNKASNITEKITSKISLTTNIGDSKFKNGTKYTINLIFKLNEIFWDPAVEDWSIYGKDIDV